MKIIILDYTMGDITIKNIPIELQPLDGDDILTNLGYSSSTTNYMIIEKELPIHIETENLRAGLTIK